MSFPHQEFQEFKDSDALQETLLTPSGHLDSLQRQKLGLIIFFLFQLCFPLSKDDFSIPEENSQLKSLFCIFQLLFQGSNPSTFFQN